MQIHEIVFLKQQNKTPLLSLCRVLAVIRYAVFTNKKLQLRSWLLAIVHIKRD